MVQAITLSDGQHIYIVCCNYNVDSVKMIWVQWNTGQHSIMLKCEAGKLPSIHTAQGFSSKCLCSRKVCNLFLLEQLIWWKLQVFQQSRGERSFYGLHILWGHWGCWGITSCSKVYAFAVSGTLCLIFIRNCLRFRFLLKRWNKTSTESSRLKPFWEEAFTKGHVSFFQGFGSLFWSLVFQLTSGLPQNAQLWPWVVACRRHSRERLILESLLCFLNRRQRPLHLSIGFQEG